MYNDEYEFEYNRVVEDSEELYETTGPSREWIIRMAAGEDAAQSTSVGGMAADLGYEPDYDDFPDQQDYEYYYINVLDELDNE